MDLDSVSVAELEEFGCPLVVINKLEERGIILLKDLLKMTPGELATIRQIGRKRSSQVVQAARAHRARYKW